MNKIKVKFNSKKSLIFKLEKKKKNCDYCRREITGKHILINHIGSICTKSMLEVKLIN